jgi:hypothetical protein
MRGMPKGRRYANDRAPTLEEIRKVLGYPDRRIKPILYTMTSSGIRLSAWDYLKWKHIVPVSRNDQIAAAKILVYADDDDEYFSFISREAFDALNNRIEDRGGSNNRNNTNLLPLIITFLVEDISREEAVKKAAGICEWYERKSLPGITYCIANTRTVLAGSFDDLFELFNAHNAIFLTKSNKIYRLRIDDDHFYSLLI